MNCSSKFFSTACFLVGLNLTMGVKSLHAQFPYQEPNQFQPQASFDVVPNSSSAMPFNPIALSNFEVEVAQDPTTKIPVPESNAVNPPNEYTNPYFSNGAPVARRST